MERLQFENVVPQLLKQIKAGAFLCVQAGDDLNVMTIGWASFGFIWGKPIMTIAVRPTRHTFGIIERARDFTVSVPSVSMGKELECCGTESGRNCNKLKKCNLELFPSIKARTPILAVPGIHFECKMVCTTAINPKTLIEEYKHLYPQKDYHTLYYGEIIECYSTADERMT